MIGKNYAQWRHVYDENQIIIYQHLHQSAFTVIFHSFFFNYKSKEDRKRENFFEKEMICIIILKGMMLLASDE